jgi:UDP-N-acetylmuramoyl-L-alanyl-D-glutamate--2,6-diaminopimelate ligase
MPDRQAAITAAVETAEPDDTILIAGKGHENYQIIGNERQHFDDVECAAHALAVRLRVTRDVGNGRVTTMGSRGIK